MTSEEPSVALTMAERTLVEWRPVWGCFTCMGLTFLFWRMKGVMASASSRVIGTGKWGDCYGRPLPGIMGILSARDYYSFRGAVIHHSLKGGPHPSRKGFYESIMSGAARFLNPTARGISHRYKNRSTCKLGAGGVNHREAKKKIWVLQGNTFIACKYLLQLHWAGPCPGQCQISAAQWTDLHICRLVHLRWVSSPAGVSRLSSIKWKWWCFMISSECKEFSMPKELCCVYTYI